MCLYLRGNVPVAMSGVFWRRIYRFYDVDCVTQHMDFDITRLNPSVLATSYAAFMLFKGFGGS